MLKPALLYNLASGHPSVSPPCSLCSGLANPGSQGSPPGQDLEPWVQTVHVFASSRRADLATRKSHVRDSECVPSSEIKTHPCTETNLLSFLRPPSDSPFLKLCQFTRSCPCQNQTAEPPAARKGQDGDSQRGPEPVPARP